nr:MAG TPA: hypothetical protein [Microviridae sp.]
MKISKVLFFILSSESFHKAISLLFPTLYVF